MANGLRHLTAKARNTPAREIVFAALSGGFGALVFGIGSEDLWKGKVQGEDIVYTILAVLLLTWAVLIPLIRAVRNGLRRRTARRLSKALAAVEEEELPLSRLDDVTGVRGAERKLEKLIAKGFLQKLAIDEDADCVWLDNPPPDEPDGETPEPDGTQAVLARIRRLNEDIENETVSAQIDRIEALTASIFQAVRQRPERADAVRKFVNYYLPTTLKLLQTYSLMEDQSYQGENIRGSRRRIEEILGKLVYAVEQQQDRLFQSDALDVESDIRVLETMMSVDGLQRRTGTGT